SGPTTRTRTRSTSRTLRASRSTSTSGCGGRQRLPPDPAPYQVRSVTVVAKGADVIVREYVLDPGEFIPWHHHTEMSDRFYGLERTIVVETIEPPARH